MSITNPSPNVLINGFATTDGVDVLESTTHIIFTLEDSAGVNVWTLECIGTDETNDPEIINTWTGFVSQDIRQVFAATIQSLYPTQMQTGTALIFRSTVNNGVDINGNLRDDYTTTVGVYIRTDDGYGIPNNDFRVGATNEITEGDSQTGWTSKLNEVIRAVGQPLLATTTYPGIITLAGDLGGTGLLPKVLKINGTSVDASPDADDVLTAINPTTSDWKKIVNANVSGTAAISVSKLAPGGAGGQILVTSDFPFTAAWAVMGEDATINASGNVTLQKLRGKTLNTSLASIGATEDGYALTWNNGGGYWEAKPSTGGGGGPSGVTWAGDLAGSTDTLQYVSAISGTSTGDQVLLGNSGANFLLGGGTSLFDTTISARHTSSGTQNGNDLTLQSGDGGTGTGGHAQGNLNLTLGRAGSVAGEGGVINFVHKTADPSSAEVIFANFGYGGYLIDPGLINSASSATLDSGTGGTILSSDGVTAISGAGVTITSDASTDVVIDPADELFVGGAPSSHWWRTFGVNLAFNTVTDDAQTYIYNDTSRATGTTAGSMVLKAQDATSAVNGGNVIIQSGNAGGSGQDGTIYLVTGGTLGSATDQKVVITSTSATIIPTTTLTSLAGSGSGYVAVNNSGVLSFTSTANPGGSAGGDLGGTYPNPTVVAITGAAGAVPIAATGNILTWAAATTAPGVSQTSTSGGSGATMTIAAQNATGAFNNGGGLVLAGGTSGSATAGTVVIKTANTTRLTAGATGVITIANLSTGVVHADSSGNLTSSTIVNADVSSSAAIAVSKLAAGSAGQFLINDTNPTPTWVTLANDVVLSNTSGAMRVDSFGHGTAAATTFPTSAGSVGNTMYISSAGVLSFAALNLAGGSGYVTGSLPAGNQANQTMTGDVSGTTGANTVDKIKNRVVNDTDPNNGDVLTWDEANNYWEYGPASGITWANDLAGSTATNQYVAAISGSAGAGGTVPLNITTLQFAASQIAPKIHQADETVNDGEVMYLQSQNATASGKFGGNLFLSTGTGPSSSFDGTLHLQTGAVSRVSIANTGVVSIINLSTGIVHADSGGALTSSLLVNADVSASAAIAYSKLALSNSIVNADINSSAAIAYSKLNLSGAIVNADISTSAAVAVSKLAAGTAAQVLLNNATPTPTWTSISGDITLSSAGAVTVTKVQGNAFKAETPGAGQDSYVLTWVNANNQFEVQPQSGGSGITTVGTIDSQTKSANGLVISGVNIYAQTADASFPGLMSTGTQTIAGAKTFSSQIVAGSTTGVNTLTGGNIWTTRTLAADLTIDTTTKDMIILCSTAAARNITLPAPVNGRIFIIKDSTGQAETNNITLIRNGSEKIEGIAASRILSTNWGVWTITTDGTDWFFI